MKWVGLLILTVVGLWVLIVSLMNGWWWHAFTALVATILCGLLAARRD